MDVRRYRWFVGVAGAIAVFCAVPRRTESYFAREVPAESARPVNPRPTALPAPRDRESFVNSVGMRMIRVPAGNYLNGSPLTERNRVPDEVQHDVQVAAPFWISQTEVTQAEWRSIMSYNPSQVFGDHLPVHNVTFWEARGFCGKLAALEGKRYRLPIEAEWEYACRAGTSTPYATGETLTSDQARFGGEYRKEGKEFLGPEQVGTFPPNAWGLFDMHGNVAEWALNRYVPSNRPEAAWQDDPYFIFAVDFPLRGGGWDSRVADCRSARRDHANPAVVADTVGFRVIMEAEE